VGNVELSNVLYVEDLMADCFVYVHFPIQSVPVDQPLGTKHENCHSVLHVKLPLCVTRKIATCVILKTAKLYYA